MRIFIIILFCISSISRLSAQDADSLKVVKLDDRYNLVFIQGDTTNEDREFVLKYWDGIEKQLEFANTLIKFENNRLIISIKTFCNPYNRDFYLKNFPSTKSLIDTSQHYNTIELGSIIGTLNSKGRFEFNNVCNDIEYLTNTNYQEVRKLYEELSLGGDFAQWNCKNFKEAYLLFEQITWLTYLDRKFTLKEYLSLDDLLVPCLGAEYGEDWLGARELIWFTESIK
jgi:hypothetical protein